MSSLLRKHQQPLMIFVTILVILAFVLYWNGPTGSRNRLPHESDDAGKIYGNTVTITMLRHENQKALLAAELHLDLVYSPDSQRFAGLAAPASTQNEAINNFIWNSLVLHHEADLLQIEPTDDMVHSDDSVAEAIKTLPAFQTDGQFDPAKYADFVANTLPSLGFGADDLEELIAEDLRMKKVKALLATTFAIPPDEFRTRYTLTHQKIDASVIHFNPADFTAAINVSDADVKDTFEKHLEGYKSDEKRGIEYVTFALSDDEKKLTGKPHIDALQKISNTVQDFTQAVQQKGANFDEVAAKFKAPVTTVAPIAGTAPDPKVPLVVLETAFQTLTEANPVSDPLPDETGSSYYVARLQQIVPSKLLTLDEARPQIIDQIKNSRAQETLAAKAHEVHTKIQADMTAGKSFADAAKAEGQKVDTVPAFSLVEPDLAEDDARTVLFKSLEMKEGELSDFVPSQETGGGVIIYIDKREPIDPQTFEQDRAKLEPAYNDEQVDFVFSEWLRKHRAAANIISDLAGGKPTPVPAPQQ
jgi:peptidyl-prolyl cis-trans isomerase D